MAKVFIIYSYIFFNTFSNRSVVAGQTVIKFTIEVSVACQPSKTLVMYLQTSYCISRETIFPTVSVCLETFLAAAVNTFERLKQKTKKLKINFPRKNGVAIAAKKTRYT